MNKRVMMDSTSRKTPTVSVVIPTLNESKGIGSVLENIRKLKRRHPSLIREVIVVDGNSTDGTADIARSYGAKVVLEKRKGYGRAYRTGFARARGDLIATLDGDGSYDPAYIPKMLEVLEREDADFVSGDRLKLLQKESMPLFRNIGNSLISVGSNILFSTNIKDNQSGMWVFRKRLLNKLVLKEDGMPFSTEIKLETYKKGKFVEIPVKFYEREGKRSTNALKQGYTIFKYLLKKRFSL